MSYASNLPHFPGSASVTTTWDAPNCLLVKVDCDEGYWRVTDLVGLRFGHAKTFGEAMDDWRRDVEALLAMSDDELGEPLLSEVRAYRKALT